MAAAKASFSTASGYRIESDPRPPSQKQTPRGGRRRDPLDGIFEQEVVPLLVECPALRAVTIFDDFSYVTKDQAETSVLFELISARYEQRSNAPC